MSDSPTRPQTPALTEREHEDTDVPVECSDEADAPEQFRERYGLTDNDVFLFLRNNGKIIGSQTHEGDKIETWHLRDGLTVQWNADEEQVQAFFAEYNSRLMTYAHRGNSAYVPREELNYPD